jgi:hypothetical protein
MVSGLRQIAQSPPCSSFSLKKSRGTLLYRQRLCFSLISPRCLCRYPSFQALTLSGLSFRYSNTLSLRQSLHAEALRFLGFLLKSNASIGLNIPHLVQVLPPSINGFLVRPLTKVIQCP